MSASEWVPLAGLAVTVIGWFIRLERRMGTFLPRDEHNDICQGRQDELKDLLAEIRASVHEMAEDSQKHRERVNDHLGHIRTQIAVIRTKQGEHDVLGDTGRFKP